MDFAGLPCLTICRVGVGIYPFDPDPTLKVQPEQVGSLHCFLHLGSFGSSPYSCCCCFIVYEPDDVTLPEVDEQGPCGDWRSDCLCLVNLLVSMLLGPCYFLGKQERLTDGLCSIGGEDDPAKLGMVLLCLVQIRGRLREYQEGPGGALRTRPSVECCG